MDKNTKEELANALGKFFGTLVLVVLTLVIGGYVTMFLWNGLIAPTFGVLTLTWAQAIGLDVFISFSTAKTTTNTEDSILMVFAKATVSTLLFMLIGWVVMFFI
ncbi:hypothetical protein [Kochikohdavirus PBEF19]|uniref:Uncharacterized protein n=1 Tax=Enterococcus phage PBEF129 TaxID=2696337 RepID=A0A7T3MLE0_9CAUD|nr:hypothetical protein [Enterococcus phage PBEF129]